MLRHLILIVAGLVAAPAAWAATPNADFTPSRTSACLAPCAVYFDARNSSDADIQPPFDLLDLNFKWDFGDPGSGVWSRGARGGSAKPHPRNEDTGPWAGHVYESPGTYTVTLSVCDDAASCDTTTRTVTVTDPDTQISSSNTWCFSNDSDFNGCPAGARQQTTNDFSAALNSTCDIQSGSRRCLFKRGDNFVSNSSVSLDHQGPGIIGAFGSGAKPAVTWSGHTVFRTGGAGVQDWRIMDLDFTGNHNASWYEVAGRRTQRVTILRVDIRDANDSLDFYAGAAFTPGVNMHQEIAFVESTTLSAGGNVTIDVFFGGEKSMFMGSHMGMLDTPQHATRWNWMDGVVISHNRIGGGNHSLNGMKIHNNMNGDHSGRYCTSNFILADNLVESPKDGSNDIVIGVNGNRPEECVRTFIVERNLFHMDQNTDDYVKPILTIRGGPGMIRNNAFDLSDVEQIAGVMGIQVYEQVPNQTTNADYTRVINNSFFSSTNQSNSTGILIDGSAANCIVRNNIGYFPQPNFNLLVDNGQNTQSCADCNVRVGGGTSPYVSNAPRGIWDFIPRAGGPAIGAGVPVTNAAFDLDGNARPPGFATDLGAIHVQGGSLPDPTAPPPPNPTPPPGPTPPPPGPTPPPPGPTTPAPPAPPVLLP